MCRRVSRSIWSTALVLLLPSAASAGWIQIAAECDGSTMTIDLSTNDPGGLPELVGFDIYRLEVGPCGATEIRITETPLPRQAGTVSTQTIFDEGLANDTAFRYQALPVDANRETVGGAYDDYFYDSFESSWIDVAACGLGVVAHGLVDPGWPGFTDCEVTCYAGEYIWIGDDQFGLLNDFYDTDTYVYLYGDVQCGWEGCAINVAFVEAALCEEIVPVQEASWTDVKALYR